MHDISTFNIIKGNIEGVRLGIRRMQNISAH